MKPGFEQTLRGFSEVAKDEAKLKKQQDGGGLNDLSKVIDWHLEKAAEKHGKSSKIQQEIYDIQKEKQKIMERLKEDLACLDNPECDYEKKMPARCARFDFTANAFVYQDDFGREQTATFGEILTDMDWGTDYHLDKKSVPRPMFKRYLVEQAKKELMRLLNLQLIKGDTSRSKNLGALLWQSKTPFSKTDQLKKEYSNIQGFIAEIMVQTFLKQLVVDNELPFEIKEADVYQDIEEKIDFIIRRKEKYKGVEVDIADSPKTIGIQFTIRKGEKVLLHKKQQIEKAMVKLTKEGNRIQDIVLIRVPLKMIGSLYAKYESEGRTAGGLNKFLHQDTAKRLWFELTKAILTDEESAAYWEKIKDKFSTAQ